MERAIAAAVKSLDVYTSNRTQTPPSPRAFAVSKQAPPAATTQQSVPVNLRLPKLPLLVSGEGMDMGSQRSREQSLELLQTQATRVVIWTATPVHGRTSVEVVTRAAIGCPKSILRTKRVKGKVRTRPKHTHRPLCPCKTAPISRVKSIATFPRVQRPRLHFCPGLRR